jgi:hypothetical protein
MLGKSAIKMEKYSTYPDTEMGRVLIREPVHNQSVGADRG